MIFCVLYFDSSKGQNPMTRHLNVCGAQRFQTPSYILSPLDFGPQPSLECPFLFLLSFLSGHSETPPATAVLFCCHPKEICIQERTQAKFERLKICTRCFARTKVGIHLVFNSDKGCPHFRRITTKKPAFFRRFY